MPMGYAILIGTAAAFAMCFICVRGAMHLNKNTNMTGKRPSIWDTPNVGNENWTPQEWEIHRWLIGEGLHPQELAEMRKTEEWIAQNQSRPIP